MSAQCFNVVMTDWIFCGGRGGIIHYCDYFPISSWNCSIEEDSVVFKCVFSHPHTLTHTHIHTRARAREYTLRRHKGIILKRPKQKTLDTNPTRGKPNQSNYQLNPIKYYLLYICNCFQLFVYGQSTRTGGPGRGGGGIAGMRRFNEYANASMRHCRCGNVCEICKWGDFMRLNRAAELIAKFNLKITKSPVTKAPCTCVQYAN